MKVPSPPSIRPAIAFQSRPVVSNIAILHGSLELESRPPFNDPYVEKAIKKAVTEAFSDNPGRHERVFELASRALGERRLVQPGLDPKDPFQIPWPLHLEMKTDHSRCLLCVGLGSSLPMFGPGSRIEKNAFDDFLKLESPEDCRDFAMKWGLLGDWQASGRSYVIRDSSDVGNRIAAAKELLGKGLLGAGARALKLGLRSSVYGEPLDAWLWHGGRLRTWRTLLGTSNLRRQLRILSRPLELFKLPKPGHSPTEGVLLEGWFVPHLSPELSLPANWEDSEAIKNAKAWEYAVHQEGGFLRFAHQRFISLREMSEKPLDARFEGEVVNLIRQLLQETLARKVNFQPFSHDGFASVEPDSLLSWLYLEFANRHADVLGGTVRSAPCENPGCLKLAISRGVGRIRRYCSDSCKTAAHKKRKGSESSST